MKKYCVFDGKKIFLTEEQAGQLQQLAVEQKIRLADVPVGETFSIGNLEFVVLEHLADMTAVISKGLVDENVEFGSNNNYADSDVDKICCEFAERLAAEVGEENVLEHTVDLTSDDGLKDYGQIERKASLLTTENYRKYVEVLDTCKPDKWWWLATPHSTAKHGNASWVKCVSPDGYIGGYNYINGIGVRPFCILKSNIFVSGGEEN